MAASEKSRSGFEKTCRYLSPLAILAVWEAVSRSGLFAAYILPAPTAIAKSLVTMIWSGEIVGHIWISVLRALAGFSIGSTLGVFLGLLIGWSRIIREIADLPLQFLRSVPKSALMPLVIVWFGLGEASKIFMVTTPPFFLTLINTISGVKNVDMLMIKAARSLGANNRQMLLHVVIPSSMPMIFAGLRLGIVISLVLLVMAEMIAANNGLGFFILEQQRFWETDRMFAGIVLMSFIGVFFDRTILSIERRVLRWHKGKTVFGS